MDLILKQCRAVSCKGWIKYGETGTRRKKISYSLRIPWERKCEVAEVEETAALIMNLSSHDGWTEEKVKIRQRQKNMQRDGERDKEIQRERGRKRGQTEINQQPSIINNCVRPRAMRRSYGVGGGAPINFAAPPAQKSAAAVRRGVNGRWSSLILHTYLNRFSVKKKLCYKGMHAQQLKILQDQAFNNKRLQNEAGWRSDS